MDFFRRLCRCVRRDAVNPAERKQDLSGSFNEQYLSLDQLAKRFPRSGIDAADPSKSTGLKGPEASRLLAENGPNALKPPKEMSNIEMFLHQFLNGLWMLLLGAAALCFFTYILEPEEKINLFAGIALVTMVVVMCFVEFWQEKSGRSVVRGFSTLLPTECAVIRDGIEQKIQPANIVLGDIVVVRNGAKVPADLRLIKASDVKLETSSITGEAEPFEYHANPVQAPTKVFEAYNIAFNGCFCVDGEGLGVVIRTGENTIIGQIAALTTDQQNQPTTLEKELSRFVRFVTVMALVMGVVIFLTGCFVNHFNNVMHLFIAGFIVVICANVPQGLPATVTSQLTIIARRMAEEKVFIKKLDIIEAFGATTVIASDKTGTITKNNMTVVDLWYNEKYLSGLANLTNRTTRVKSQDGMEDPLPDLLSVCVVCNRAQMTSQQTVHATRHHVQRRRTVSRQLSSDPESTVQSNALTV